MAELLFSSLFIWLIPVFIGACILGFFIPRKYTLEGATTINASPAVVWEVITDFEKYPLWLSYVSSLKCEDKESQIWLQEGTIAPIRFRVLKSIPEKVLQLEVVRGNIPIRGGRLFTIDQVGPQKTHLKLIQSGEVTNLFLRSYLFLFHRKPNPVAIYIDGLTKHFLKEAISSGQTPIDTDNSTG